MKTPISLPLSMRLFVAFLAVIPLLIRAEVMTFTVDSSASPLSVGGSLSGVQGQEQGAGSLTTSFTGFILVDVQGSSVEFVGGSEIGMTESGPWAPAPGGGAGEAPASLAGIAQNFLATATGALRDVELDVTSDVIPLVSGVFDGSGLMFAFPEDAISTADYRVAGLISDSGSEALAGYATNGVISEATLGREGSGWVLTLPVDLSGSTTVVSDDDLHYWGQGQIVARAVATTPLEVSDFQVVPGQLQFNIATVPGQSYSILVSDNLTDWNVLQQFIAQNDSEALDIALEVAPRRFFRIRQD